MAKSKHAPALFEVIQTGQERKKGVGKLALPKWWRSDETKAPPPVDEAPIGVEGGQAAQIDEPVEPDEVEAESAAEPAEVQPTSPEEAAEAPVTDRSAPRASGWIEDATAQPGPVRVRSGRLEISLNPVNAAVVGGVLLLAVLCSYKIGQRIGSSSDLPAPPADTGRHGASSIEGALRQPLQRGALDVGSTGPGSGGDTAGTPARAGADGEIPAPARPEKPSAPVRSTGRMHYVVLQIFARDHKGAAERAQEVLQSKYGITALLEPRGEKWQLISRERFDFSREDQKERAYQYGGGIKALGEALGKELAAAGLPVYRFADPYVELEK